MIQSSQFDYSACRLVFSVDDIYTVYRSHRSTYALIPLLRHITYYTKEYQTLTRVHTMKLTNLQTERFASRH